MWPYDSPPAAATELGGRRLKIPAQRALNLLRKATIDHDVGDPSFRRELALMQPGWSPRGCGNPPGGRGARGDGWATLFKVRLPYYYAPQFKAPRAAPPPHVGGRTSCADAAAGSGSGAAAAPKTAAGAGAGFKIVAPSGGLPQKKPEVRWLGREGEWRGISEGAPLRVIGFRSWSALYRLGARRCIVCWERRGTDASLPDATSGIGRPL
jgi:hypothetical protein